MTQSFSPMNRTCELPYRTALVTGGTGLIGSHFLPLLNARFPELEVTVAARSRFQPERGSRHSHIFMDLSKPVSLSGSYDIVFHIAGINGDGRTMVDINCKGTRRLLDWIADRGIKRLVHVSSIAVYGAGCGPALVDERSPMRPRGVYERSKKIAEDSVKHRCKGLGIEYVILQPSNVLSARRFKELQLLNLMTQIRRGLFFYLSRNEVTFNYISADAVASGLCAAVLPKASNRTFILNTPADLQSVVGWIADEVGVQPPRKRAPQAFGQCCAAIASALSHLSGVRLPFSYPRYRELTLRTRYVGNHIVESLGFAYAPSLEAAIRSLTRRYINDGIL